MSTLSATIVKICHSPYLVRVPNISSCSVKCFKTHILEHENDIKPSEPTETTPATLDAPNSPSQEQKIVHDTTSANPIPETPPNPYESLLQHPQFQPLFTRYPNLKSQLQRVHNATKNPAISIAELVEEGKINGHGGRNQQGDRVRGQWTQEKANELAADVLVSLMEQEEGVREFMALVKIVYEPLEQVEGDAKMGGQVNGIWEEEVEKVIP